MNVLGDFEGTIAPTFMSQGRSRGADLLQGLPLRMGRVMRVHKPSDVSNVSKRFREYDVAVDVAGENAPSTRFTIPHCLVMSAFGGIADYSSWTPRVSEVNAAEQNNYGSGSRVLVLLINGSSFGGVIIGGVQSAVAENLQSSPVPVAPTADVDVSAQMSRIDTSKLWPPFHKMLQNLLARCAAKGAVYHVLSGYRSFVEQDALYAQGRTTPGKRVTNARRGESYHNFGLAVDFVRDFDLKKKGVQLGTSHSDPESYRILAEEAQAIGLTAGLLWKNPDPPHVELKLSGSLTFQALKALVKTISADDFRMPNGQKPTEKDYRQAIFDALDADTLLVANNAAAVQAAPVVALDTVTSPPTGQAEGAKGHHAITQFNGVRAEIDDAGAFKLSVKGPTDAVGALRDPDFEAKSGTNIAFRDGGVVWEIRDVFDLTAEGDFVWRSGAATSLQSSGDISILSNAGNITIETHEPNDGTVSIRAPFKVLTDSTFVQLGAGTDQMIKGTTYRVAETTKNTAEVTARFATFSAMIALAPFMVVLDPTGTTTSLCISSALAEFSAGIAINTFEGSGPNFLSFHNSLD